MRRTKNILPVAAAFVVLVALCLCFFAWNLQRSLGKVDWKGFAELVEAPLGTTVTRSAVRRVWPPASAPAPSSRKAASGWTAANPERIREGDALARTYVAALAVGRVALRYVNRGSSLPATSLALVDVESKQKVDGWGHAFCLVKVDGRIAVVSGGPDAKKTVACQRRGIDAGDIIKLKPAILYEYPAGTLVLVMRPTEARSG